ncbi:MAG TPA: efflux RND transporter periplasmic adaptor subunit [Candidatus Limnocylindrales bacterium]|jgi:RND family efflux transporter MFP subunit|nr:efflux RND transporter periplasmic adaptor subunit [Candidatus Limnocylindrales bacterium]
MILQRTKTRLSSLAAVLIALGAFLAAAGCSHKQASADEDSASGPKPVVTLTRVARGDIAETLTLTGTAAALPNQDVRVSSLVPGRIAELHVAEGDHVEAGQLLAKLDDRPYQDQLRQAEAAAALAAANHKNAQLSLARNEDLFQRGIVARKDLEDARTAESVAAASERQAEAALSLARLQLARTNIASPINGTVAKRFVSVGEQADGTAAQPIVEVANLHEVEFLGNAPAAYLAKMHLQEVVDVTSEAVPGQKFSGRVVGISPAVDPATGVGLVRIRIPNPGGILRMGMYLSAQVPVDHHSNAQLVPSEAIYRDAKGEARVFVVDKKDEARAVPVKLGIETKEQVEILEGVKEGDSVILTGGYGLGDTAHVQVKP